MFGVEMTTRSEKDPRMWTTVLWAFHCKKVFVWVHFEKWFHSVLRPSRSKARSSELPPGSDKNEECLPIV